MAGCYPENLFSHQWLRLTGSIGKGIYRNGTPAAGPATDPRPRTPERRARGTIRTRLRPPRFHGTGAGFMQPRTGQGSKRITLVASAFTSEGFSTVGSVLLESQYGRMLK